MDDYSQVVDIFALVISEQSSLPYILTLGISPNDVIDLLEDE